MNNEIDVREPIGLSQPIIEKDKDVGTRWVEIPIVPVFDKDAASLPLGERVERVKNYQHDYFEPFLRKEFPDLFDTARPDSIRLALTLEDMEIKEYELKIAQNRYQSEANSANEQRLITAETLAGTVIDSFIKDFFLSPDGINRLYVSIDDVTTHTNFSEQDIIKLFSKAKKRLHTLQSPEHAASFRYKTGSDNLTNGKNAEMLKQLVNVAFTPAEKNNLLDKQVHNTAEAILDFYWHNYKDLYPPDEDTPLVALVHDYFFAASLPLVPDFFVVASDWLTKRLVKNKELFWSEMTKNYQFFRAEVETIVDKLQKAQAARRPEGNLINFIASPDEEYINEFLTETGGKYMMGKHYDRHIGIESAFNFLEEYKRPNLYKEGSFIVAERADNFPTGGELEKRIELDLVVFDWRKVVSAYAQDIYLLDALVTIFMSKEKYLDVLSPLANFTPSVLKTSAWYQNMLSKVDLTSRSEVAQTIANSNLAINAMFIENSPPDKDSLNKLLDRNRLRFDRIREANIWFVATNGDSFPVDLNPELAGYSVRNLTFYPDRQTGGHRIKIDTTLQDKKRKPITLALFVDRYGNSYYGNRNPAILNLFLTAAMQDLVLKYLYYITSGAASKKGEATVDRDQGEGEAQEVDLLLHRRHHYRYLTSTATRTYTLQSPEAKKHRDFVLAKYGIDIYEENLRRRRVHTLKPSQVITFVREIENQEAPPNVLTYQDIEV